LFAVFLTVSYLAAQHYYATLCKEAWEKKFAYRILICFLMELANAKACPAQVTQYRRYCINNCDTSASAVQAHFL